MKTLNKIRWVMAVVAMGVSLYGQAYEGESIVLDPVTGDYTITYWDDTDYSDEGNGPPSGLDTTIFVPATKIIPTILSKFKLGDAGLVIYRYNVSNGMNAKQAIVGVSLKQSAGVTGQRDIPMTGTVSEIEQAFLANTSALVQPVNWGGNIRGTLERSSVVWNPDDLETGGVQAGSSLAGFGFTSLALPGLSVARMEGIGGIFGYTGEGPAMDSAIRPELERLRQNDFIAQNAAVPTIPVPSPFNAAVTLERIRDHMHTWIDKQLIDAAFSAQLDLSFQAAISAYRANQPLVGKQHVETMRELIKQQQPDADKEEATSGRTTTLPALIDLLAARILFFDLNYVTERGS